MSAPKAFKAPHPVYVGGVYYKPGEIFVTDDTKGEGWVAVGQAEKAATEASQDIPGDPPLDSLGVDALRAVAVTKHVNPEGLSKKDLISAIKAANEPHL